MPKVLLHQLSSDSSYLVSEKGGGAKSSGGIRTSNAKVEDLWQPHRSNERRPSPRLSWASTASGVHPQNTGKLPKHPITWASNGTLILSITLTISSADLFEDVVVTTY